MSICPKCHHPELDRGRAVELAPDDEWDEIQWSTAHCPRCGCGVLLVYTEERRGSHERWAHRGTILSLGDSARMSSTLKSCPAPTDRSCRCPAHAAFALAGDGQRPGALESLRIGAPDWFAVQLAAPNPHGE